MKKLSYIKLSVVAFLFALAACTTDGQELNPENEPTKAVYLEFNVGTGEIENTDSTRVGYDDAAALPTALWKDGDVISIHDFTTEECYGTLTATIEGGGMAKKASFAGELQIPESSDISTMEFRAVYPAFEGNLAQRTVQALNTTQVVGSAAHLADAAHFASNKFTSAESIFMKHDVTYYKFTFPNPAETVTEANTISKIVLTNQSRATVASVDGAFGDTATEPAVALFAGPAVNNQFLTMMVHLADGTVKKRVFKAATYNAGELNTMTSDSKEGWSNVEEVEVSVTAEGQLDAALTAAGAPANYTVDATNTATYVEGMENVSYSTIKVNGTISLADYKSLLLRSANVLDLSGVTGITNAAVQNYNALQIPGDPWAKSVNKGYLQKVIMPDSFTAIQWNAFNWCQNLREVVWNPTGKVTLGAGAFTKTSLTNETVASLLSHETYVMIQQNTFKQNPVMTEVNIPAHITQLQQLAFYENPNMTKIVLNTFITPVLSGGNFANPFPSQFEDGGTCYISVPYNSGLIEKYEANDYYKMYQFKEMDPVTYTVNVTAGDIQTALDAAGVPTDVTFDKLVVTGDLDAADYEILNAYKAREIDFSKSSITTIPSTTPSTMSFRNNKILTKVSLPAGFTYFGGNNFNGCSSLAEVIFADNETVNLRCGWNTFSGTSLSNESVQNILNKLGANTKLQNQTFKNILTVTNITLPANVVSLDHSVFFGCTNLKSITIKADIAPSVYLYSQYGTVAKDSEFPTEFYGAADANSEYVVYVLPSQVEAYSAIFKKVVAIE